MSRPLRAEWSARVSESIEVINEADVSYVVAHVPGKGLYATNIVKYEGGSSMEVRVNALRALTALLTHELNGISEYIAWCREQDPEAAENPKNVDKVFGRPKPPSDDPAIRGS